MNWTSFEAQVQTCALDPKPMQYVRFREGLKRTRLTYNCAHLRSTKESPTFECFDTGWYLVVLGQYRTVHVQLDI